uniref:Cell cycle checkpoint control protein RAD9A n=1 Tax=Malurus cyaneus samueli TaxID=2593467 RepID=A0A8C5T662_9PASS
MRCVIAGGNVKVLGRAVHSLSRIGDELYLEPTESGLSLRAVNSSRSAFASFLFAPLFFELYEPGIAGPDTELFRCKVHMKSFLSVFRSLPSLEKSVGKCLILLKPRASRLVLQLHCKYGVTKTHNLAFQECERLQAVFDTQRCSSRLCAQLLAEAVVHFPPTLAEVTLGTGPGGKISLRNYMEDEAGDKTMVTELWLAEDEFQLVAVPQAPTSLSASRIRVSPTQAHQPCVTPSPSHRPLCPRGCSLLRPPTPYPSSPYAHFHLILYVILNFFPPFLERKSHLLFSSQELTFHPASQLGGIKLCDWTPCMALFLEPPRAPLPPQRAHSTSSFAHTSFNPPGVPGIGSGDVGNSPTPFPRRGGSEDQSSYSCQRLRGHNGGQLEGRGAPGEAAPCPHPTPTCR